MIAPIAPVASWMNRLRSRLYLQFRGKPNLTALSDMTAAQGQDLEDASQSLLGGLSVDDAEGLQLQVIGRVVGQPFNGETDPVYRRLLKARVLANKSSGTLPQLYAIFALIWSGAMEIVEWFPAALGLYLTGVPLTDATTLAVYVSLLLTAKEGGVRALLFWEPAPTAQMFTCPPLPAFLSVATHHIDTTLAVSDQFALTDWPYSGQLLLSINGASGVNALVVDYIGIFTGIITLAAPLGVETEAGSDLEPWTATDADRGFAQATYLASGTSVGASALPCQALSDFPSAWPSSGSVTVDQGTATEETLAYSSISTDTLELAGTAAYAHDENAAVTLVGGYGGALAGVLDAE